MVTGGNINSISIDDAIKLKSKGLVNITKNADKSIRIAYQMHSPITGELEEEVHVQYSEDWVQKEIARLETEISELTVRKGYMSSLLKEFKGESK